MRYQAVLDRVAQREGRMTLPLPFILVLIMLDNDRICLRALFASKYFFYLYALWLTVLEGSSSARRFPTGQSFSHIFPQRSSSILRSTGNRCQSRRPPYCVFHQHFACCSRDYCHRVAWDPGAAGCFGNCFQVQQPANRRGRPRSPEVDYVVSDAEDSHYERRRPVFCHAGVASQMRVLVLQLEARPPRSTRSCFHPQACHD